MMKCCVFAGKSIGFEYLLHELILSKYKLIGNTFNILIIQFEFLSLYFNE